ncbi:MAG: tetratricopeptide repeat protein [Phycisphaerae bacterium]|nr:tetratricopeptide repeat protein [Phycisphaerae bacterium]
MPPKDGIDSDIARALDLAFLSYKNADISKAQELCQQVLQKVPNQVDALQLLGMILSGQGQNAEAAQMLDKAIEQASAHYQLHNSLGMILYQMKRNDEAVSEFQKAIELRPDFAKAYNNLAVALMKLGRLNEAADACTKAIHLQRDFKQAYNNLGLIRKKQGKLTESEAAYTKAIALDPEYAEALSNFGMALVAGGKFEQAGENLQKAVDLSPNCAEFHNNLGVLFNRQGRFEEAIAASSKAIAISSDYIGAYNNLGTALMEIGRFDEAVEAFEKAIAIDSEQAEPHFNRSLILLLTGRFEQGWKEYEWRWKNSGFSTPIRPFTQKRWDGSVEGVVKLLIWAEQGIGDEVQFAGLIQHIIAKGIDVVVECDKRFVPLLQRSFSGITVVGRSDPPAEVLKDEAITHQIPMCSIPQVLGRPIDMKPYLLPDEDLRNQLRQRYKNGKDELLVGISWKSGNSQEGPKRSLDLEIWEPILKTAGVRFVSLQYGDCSRQLQAAREKFGIEIIKDETVNPLKDIEGFAAQVSAMDLIISVDNSTVHFAGALGVKVWTLLPTVPDWRWGLGGEKTCWYPSMRLFRQKDRGKWEPVISKAAQELGSL